MQKLNKQIDKFLDVIAESILGTKSKEEAVVLTLWPIPTTQGVLYWGDEWVKKLNRVFHLIDERKVSDGKIIGAIKFPSRIVQLLWRVDAIKASDLNKGEKLYTIAKLFDFLALFRKKDLFCEKGANIVWSKEEIETHKKDLHFFSGRDRKLNKLISIFEATLWSYTEMLYWAQHPLGHSFHGPYLNKDGDLLVKEYFDLRPEVWPFSQDLNFLEVEISEIYNKGMGSKIKLEFFERNIRTTQPLKQDLERFALKVDGRIIKQAEEVSQSLENLMEVVEKGGKVIQSLNEQQIIEKHADFYFYAIKPFCDLAKVGWRPPRQVRDNIYKRHEEIDALWRNVVKKDFEKTANLPHKEQEKIIKEIFDPRK